MKVKVSLEMEFEIDEEYRWIAIDKDGSLFAFKDEPILNGAHWVSKSKPKKLPLYAIKTNWKDSKQLINKNSGQ